MLTLNAFCMKCQIICSQQETFLQKHISISIYLSVYISIYLSAHISLVRFYFKITNEIPNAD